MRAGGRHADGNISFPCDRLMLLLPLICRCLCLAGTVYTFNEADVVEGVAAAGLRGCRTTSVTFTEQAQALWPQAIAFVTMNTSMLAPTAMQNILGGYVVPVGG